MRPAESAPPGRYHLADDCLAILATKLILPEIIQQAKQSLSWHALCMNEVMTQSMLSEDANMVGQVVPILRAGLVLLEQAATVLPNSQTFHVGYVRNEETLEVSHAPWCAALPHLTLRLSFRENRVAGSLNCVSFGIHGLPANLAAAECLWTLDQVCRGWR